MHNHQHFHNITSFPCMHSCQLCLSILSALYTDSTKFSFINFVVSVMRSRYHTLINIYTFPKKNFLYFIIHRWYFFFICFPCVLFFTPYSHYNTQNTGIINTQTHIYTVFHNVQVYTVTNSIFHLYLRFL